MPPLFSPHWFCGLEWLGLEDSKFNISLSVSHQGSYIAAKRKTGEKIQMVILVQKNLSLHPCQTWLALLSKGLHLDTCRILYKSAFPYFQNIMQKWMRLVLISLCNGQRTLHGGKLGSQIWEK